MLVLNLACGHDHRFEGWFGSNDDFESQQARGLIGCPVCADTTITRLPSAPRLNVAHPRGDNKQAPVPGVETTPPTDQGLQRRVLQAIQQVLAKTEDVGPRFAEEARRIHYGEAEERGIRGQASATEAIALAEEGIAVMALPLPESLKGTLQ